MPIKARPSRLIGIDFGKKRIGVALSDERRILASPLTTIEGFSSLKGAALILKEKISSYLPIESLVIGLPLHLSGDESDLSILARKFAELLREFTPSVVFWDERLSSRQVEQTMREAGLSRKKQAKLTDQLAAAAILQNYLDSRIGFLEHDDTQITPKIGF